jgi:hypothetical protein
MKKGREIHVPDWPRVSMAVADCPLQAWMDDPKWSSRPFVESRFRKWRIIVVD